jgi:hypothetical protein
VHVLRRVVRAVAHDHVTARDITALDRHWRRMRASYRIAQVSITLKFFVVELSYFKTSV